MAKPAAWCAECRRYVWLKDGGCENGHGRPPLRDCRDVDTLPENAPVRAARLATPPPVMPVIVAAAEPEPEPMPVIVAVAEPEPEPMPVAAPEPMPPVAAEPTPMAAPEPEPAAAVAVADPPEFADPASPLPLPADEIPSWAIEYGLAEDSPGIPAAPSAEQPDETFAPAGFAFAAIETAAEPEPVLPGYSGPASLAEPDPLPGYSVPAPIDPELDPVPAYSAGVTEAPAEPSSVAPWAAPLPESAPAPVAAPWLAPAEPGFEAPKPDWETAAAQQPLPPGAFIPGMPEPEMDVSIRLAPLGRRVAAYFIDSSIVGLVAFLIALFAGMAAGASLAAQAAAAAAPQTGALNPVSATPGWIFAVQAIVSLLPFLYFPLMEGLRGATIGKSILGMRVVTESGESVGVARAFIRYLGWFLDGLFAGGIGYWSASNSPLRQRFGDKWAKTVVVRI